MNEIEMIFKSIKDFFTSSMLRIALVPLIITMVILYMMFFAAADFGITALQEVAAASQNGQEVVIDENAPFYFVWATHLIVIRFDNQETATAAAVVKQFTGIACTDKRGDSRQTVEVLFICPDKTWFHSLHQRLQHRHLLRIFLIKLIHIDNGKLYHLALSITL